MALSHPYTWTYGAPGALKPFQLSDHCPQMSVITHRITGSRVIPAAAQEEVPPWAHAGVREVALLVSNHSMRVGDRGVVVVGGSAQTGDLAGHFAAGVLLSNGGLDGLCCSCLPSSAGCNLSVACAGVVGVASAWYNLELENSVSTTMQGQGVPQPCDGDETGQSLLAALEQALLMHALVP